ncbi:MAG: thioredoxin TrxC [Hyphomicrobiaceae bacterium]
MGEVRNIVCGRCGQINRVPMDRPAARARCGACHEPLFAGRPVEVDATAFERHTTRNDIPVLVDVWAPWCGPCRVMAPMFEQAAAALEPDVRLLKLNSDEAPELSARLGIRSIPTLLLIESGKVLARTSGVMRADQIVAWTRSSLAQASTSR